MSSIVINIFLFYFSFSLQCFNFQSNFHDFLTEKFESDELKILKNVILSTNKMPFSEVTTIGDSCLPKTRVKTFLQEYDPQKTIKNPNHLFDWMLPLNYTLFGEALKNRFNDSFGLEYLKVVYNYRGVGAILLNDRYNFIFTHAFDGFEEITHTRGEKCLTKENFARHYHLISKKFEHLAENSRKAFFNSKRSLYLGYSRFHPEGETQEDFLNFLRAIKIKRDGNFLMLILVDENAALKNVYEFDKILEGNLIFHKVKHYIDFIYSREFKSLWDEILKIALAQ